MKSVLFVNATIVFSENLFLVDNFPTILTFVLACKSATVDLE